MNRPIHVCIIWEFQRHYGEGMIRGIAEYGRRFGPWRFSLRPFRTALTLTDIRRRFDGIILGFDVSTAFAGIHWPASPPTVAVHWTEDAVTRRRIQVDNKAVGAMACEEFVRRNFRNLAYVPSVTYERNRQWDDQRNEGFAAAARRHGLTTLTYDGPIQQWEEISGEPVDNPLTRWLQSLPKPIGILAADDYRARSVLFQAEAAGIRVPEEAAIIGVGSEVWSDVLGGGLSSVEPDGFAIGYAAAEMLHEAIEDPTARPYVKLIPPLRLVVRRSSSSVAIPDEDVALAVRFIADRATGGIGVQDVAQAVLLSRRAIERRFRRALGRTILQEIHNQQVERAKLLLSDPSIPLRRVAKGAGFPTIKAMGRTFRRLTGKIPSAYRAEQKLTME